MSDYPKSRFIRFNKDWNLLSEVLKKDVIYPLNVKSSTPKTYVKGQTLELVFIGNDFARKGGIVALRLTKKAKKIGLPTLNVHNSQKTSELLDNLYLEAISGAT